MNRRRQPGEEVTRKYPGHVSMIGVKDRTLRMLAELGVSRGLSVDGAAALLLDRVVDLQVGHFVVDEPSRGGEEEGLSEERRNALDAVGDELERAYSEVMRLVSGVTVDELRSEVIRQKEAGRLGLAGCLIGEVEAGNPEFEAFIEQRLRSRGGRRPRRDV